MRTVIGRKTRTGDRTLRKYAKLLGIKIEPGEQAHWRAGKRLQDQLPSQINALSKQGAELIQEGRELLKR